MTRADPLTVPGIAQLLGRGVYLELPDDRLGLVSDGTAVIVADPAPGAIAALRLSECAERVTLVIRENGRCACLSRDIRSALCRRTNVQTRYGTELVWAVGIGHLEAVVLRRSTGRIEVCNASALFVLSPVSEDEHS
jgi:thioredoxin reductase (NADPH)